MNDTMVTVIGHVVDSPRFVRLQNGAVTNFRLASTARRYDAASRTFVDASTFWVDVECWNDLSSNVSGSISKGDPVIVHGMLSTHSWDTDSGRRNKPQIRASAVGPNLARGRAVFSKSQLPRSAGPQSDEDGSSPADLAASTPGAALDDQTFGEDGEELLRGRDYEGDATTLESTTRGDLDAEPAGV